ncbi:MAG: hypothetical protein KGZ54_09165 [Dethiobacter sp.]|nr:hypothetical protein [Dethiobacter sp.]MBS3902171.1 hypothetical protein [Dethiobacter sp.]MBS3989680.1 hypothetical protein [Dethiobacter sp.]
MAATVTELLEQLSANYQQQYMLYQKVHQIAQEEGSLIETREMLQLVELLHCAEEIMRRIQQLEEPQKKNRQLLREALPGNNLSLDLLACLTETRVFLRYKKVLAQLAEILAEIEQLKNKNIVRLAQMRLAKN